MTAGNLQVYQAGGGATAGSMRGCTTMACFTFLEILLHTSCLCKLSSDCPGNTSAIILKHLPVSAKRSTSDCRYHFEPQRSLYACPVTNLSCMQCLQHACSQS